LVCDFLRAGEISDLNQDCNCALSRSCCLLLLLSPALRAAEYFLPPDAQGGWRIAKDATRIRELDPRGQVN